MTDWSPDGEWVLAVSQRGGLARTQVWLLPVSAAPRAETQARFSPDGRWISFNAVREAGVSSVYVVPAAGGAWVRITDEEYWADKPRWSPDGKALYFVSNRSTGLFDVWGVRFDPAQGRPAGEPFRVTYFESPGQMIDPSFGSLEIAISGDRLVLPILEVSGSVWVLENVNQ